jgi:hypothetical protein
MTVGFERSRGGDSVSSASSDVLRWVRPLPDRASLEASAFFAEDFSGIPTFVSSDSVFDASGPPRPTGGFRPVAFFFAGLSLAPFFADGCIESSSSACEDLPDRAFGGIEGLFFVGGTSSSSTSSARPDGRGLGRSAEVFFSGGPASGDDLAAGDFISWAACFAASLAGCFAASLLSASGGGGDFGSGEESFFGEGAFFGGVLGGGASSSSWSSLDF